jgi:hypothetical protein
VNHSFRNGFNLKKQPIQREKEIKPFRIPHDEDKRKKLN